MFIKINYLINPYYYYQHYYDHHCGRRHRPIVPSCFSLVFKVMVNLVILFLRAILEKEKVISKELK